MVPKIDDLMTPDIKTVGISAHVSPDGDCVGACLGLFLYLKKNYPDVRADVFLEPIPEELRDYPGADLIRTDFTTEIEVYDLFFVLDSEKKRTGPAEAIFDRAKKTVNIDHHISNPGSAMINYVEPDASSACELMVQALDLQKIDVEIAKILYAGIVTDTGMFHYSSTSPKTMRIAADLMEFGFDHCALIEKVELERTYSQNVTTGRMLASSTLRLDGRCITAILTMEEMKAHGISPADHDYVVAQLNLTSGVECALFAYETPDGKCKVSFRSKGKVNVAEIASSLGGGGHVRASGCTVEKKPAEIIEEILPMVEAQLRRAEQG